MKYAVFLLAALSLGLTGQPVTRVAIIDTGLDLSDPRFQDYLCAEGHKDFTKVGLKDTNGHGTHIAGLIKRTAGPGNYCFIIVKYYVEGIPESEHVLRSVQAVQYAASLGVEYVNYSGGGGNFEEREYLAIRESRATFIVAAGNEKHDLAKHPYYPASYELPNIVAVGNWTINHVRSATSNYGTKVNAWEVGENQLSDLPCTEAHSHCQGTMSGTSQATAIHTGNILKGKL